MLPCCPNPVKVPPAFGTGVHGGAWKSDTQSSMRVQCCLVLEGSVDTYWGLRSLGNSAAICGFPSEVRGCKLDLGKGKGLRPTRWEMVVVWPYAHILTVLHTSVHTRKRGKVEVDIGLHSAWFVLVQFLRGLKWTQKDPETNKIKMNTFFATFCSWPFFPNGCFPKSAVEQKYHVRKNKLWFIWFQLNTPCLHMVNLTGVPIQLTNKHLVTIVLL